jgi:hypothetical protein
VRESLFAENQDSSQSMDVIRIDEGVNKNIDGSTFIEK